MVYQEQLLNEVIQQVFLNCRNRKGLTQQQLSFEANITRQFISMVEAGKRLPSISTISTVANIYHISLSEFFLEVDRIYPAIAEKQALMVAENTLKPSTYIRRGGL